jgi:hypothetical protein
VGHTLTKVAGGDVYWWNIDTGAHGHLVVPAPPTVIRGYISAAPDGVIFQSAHGWLKRKDFAGHVTRLSQPFGNQPRVLYAFANAHGLIVEDGLRHRRFISFRHPHVAHHLRSGPEICTSLSSRYAGCTNSHNVALLPLNGGKPIILGGRQFPEGQKVALLKGNRLAWLHLVRGGPHFKEILATFQPGDRKPRFGTRSLQGAVTTAYSKAVVVSRAGHKILAASRVDHLHTIVTAPHSPTTAAGFSLTSGRLIDTDDSVDTEHAPVALRARSVTASPDGVSVGDPTVLARPDSHHPYEAFEPLLPTFADGPDYGYFTGPSFRGDLHVVTRHGTTVIHRVNRNAGTCSLSWPWVSYNRGDKLHVRNLTSGADKVYNEFDDTFFPRDAVISDGDLYFGAHDESIQRVDLASGTQTEVVPSPRNANGAVSVFASSGRVGWDIRYGSGANPSSVDGIRDTDGTMISLDQRLIGLYPDGALLSSENVNFGLYAPPTTISLRRWDGTRSQLLSNIRLGEAPQIAGGVLAWLTSDGQIQASSVN